jgi:hypothetical protein
MDKAHALRALGEVLDRYRADPYDVLVSRIDQDPIIEERPGPAGGTYQVEIISVWDDRPGGNVRVMGSIDDGGWRAILPVTRSFIKHAAGGFVGE